MLRYIATNSLWPVSDIDSVLLEDSYSAELMMVTCKIKHWNNSKIISKQFYITCHHVWNLNKIISATEIILKLFQ